MKLSRVSYLLIAVALIVAGVFLYTLSTERRVNESYQGSILIHESVAAIRVVENATRALRSDQSELSLLLSNWERSQMLFDVKRHELISNFRTQPACRLPLLRIMNSWGRIDQCHAAFRVSLHNLDSAGIREKLGTSGLLNKYQEFLFSEEGSDAEIGELGLLIFNIENTGLLVEEIESDLLTLKNVLSDETVNYVRTVRGAGITVLAIAVMLGLCLLARIHHLYLELKHDNEARAVAQLVARKIEADLTITLDSIGEAVIATDVSGLVTRINPAAESLLKQREADVVGLKIQSICKLSNSGSQSEISDLVGQVIASGNPYITNDLITLQRSDESQRIVSLSCTPIRESGGELQGVVLVARDLTEKQLLEETLRCTQKLESIGQLAGGVAHDFNNYLQVVRANVSLLKDESGLSGSARENVKEIEQASIRAAGLTRQLLAFGRRQALQMKDVDPSELVRNVLSLLRRVIAENIRIEFTEEESLCWIRADAGQMEQVVINLCVNARDAMPNGGTLTLALKNVRRDPASDSRWPWSQGSDFVQLSVSDTGLGIPKETLPRIFDPFFTTKPVGLGTGLGLSVVQGIVHQHEGYIDVHSEVDMGTTFTIHLPAIPKKAQDQQEFTFSRVSRKGAVSNELILLVEDDVSVCKVTELVLQKKGFRVITACDGEDACHLAALHAADISVAILDVIMPRLGGVEAARRIQGLRKEIGIVLCTGYAGAFALSEDAKAAGWSVLVKPYTNQDLLEHIDKAVHRL